MFIHNINHNPLIGRSEVHCLNWSDKNGQSGRKFSIRNKEHTKAIEKNETTNNQSSQYNFAKHIITIHSKLTLL